jgi:tRNA pseudouridine38-40 synthase
MPRYRLTIEYDGGPYRGFQAQANQPTVQGAIEAAIHALCGEALRLQAAGRTDAGVHALGQVIHVDLEKDRPASVVMKAINAHLVPQPIAVIDCEIADRAFHARFSALGRRYLYKVLNRPGPPALDRGRLWHIRRPLSIEPMVDAAAGLIGLHDFTTFRDAACQARSPVKTLDVARVTRRGDEVHLEFEARSFLHRQVRSMVGSLAQVGLGRWSAADFTAALASRDRAACGPVAPADGLYLVSVDYGPKAVK